MAATETETSETKVADAVLDISSAWRRMIDNSLPQVIQVLKNYSLEEANLFLTILLNDEVVIRYIQDLLNFASTGQLHDVYYEYDVYFTQNPQLDFLNVEEWTAEENFYNHDVFYMSSLNYEDQVIIYLKMLLDDLEYMDSGRCLVSFGNLLAGAYFGGHDNLISIIKDKVEPLEHKKEILYMGLVGAMCAGRYHYITPNSVTLDDIEEHVLDETTESSSGLVKTHFILSRDNVTKAMSHMTTNQSFFRKAVISRIMARGSKEFILWFLTSDMAYDVSFKEITSEIAWEIVLEHRHEVKLDEYSMAFIDPLSDDDLKMYVAIRTPNNGLVRNLLYNGYQDFVKAALWAFDLMNVRAFDIIVDWSNRFGKEKRLSSNERMKSFVLRKVREFPYHENLSFYMILFGHQYGDRVDEMSGYSDSYYY